MQSLAFFLFGVAVLANGAEVPTVKTSSGHLRGVAPFPNVHAYLGIPYAEPPVGDLRFMPPQPLKAADEATTIDCFQSTPGCFQLSYVTAFSDRSTGWAESEDMLSINIWKPANTAKPLPVLVFLYGGAFTSGANGMPQYNGQLLVEEQQDFIVATINYRVNVFGFPNSDAIKTKNPGLLDQRLGMEWLRDNVEAFGGDPKRMTLMGHSAGSISIAYWSLAYQHDPIVSGLIEISGQPGLVPTDNGTAWTQLAKATSCLDASDPEAELACMRQVSPRKLKRAMSVNNLPTFTDSVIGSSTPFVDNVTAFSPEGFAQQVSAGKFAKVPLLVTHTTHEFDGTLPFSPADGVNQTMSDQYTLAAQQCLVSATAGYWTKAGVPTWRYLYAGDFDAVKPYDWLRPWHGSDLEIIFKMEFQGAYEDPSPATVAAGKHLRTAVANFVKDPEKGLESFGWKQYNPSGKTLVKLFGKESAEVSFEKPAEFDAPCKFV